MPGQQDTQNFADVADAHYRRIFRGALSLTGDRHLAEELVQETFLVALRKYENFTGAASLFTWLYGIMLNKYRDHCRRRRLLSRLGFVRAEDNLVATSNTGTENPSQADRAANRDDNHLLVEAVERLPFKLRTVIAMHYFDDMSLNEIAAILNCRLGTVKSRVFNARKRLYRTLKGKLRNGS